MPNQFPIRFDHSGSFVPKVKSLRPAAVSPLSSTSLKLKENQARQQVQDRPNPSTQSNAEHFRGPVHSQPAYREQQNSFYRHKEFGDLSKNSQRAVSLYESFSKSDINSSFVSHLDVRV